MDKYCLKIRKSKIEITLSTNNSSLIEEELLNISELLLKKVVKQTETTVENDKELPKEQKTVQKQQETKPAKRRSKNKTTNTAGDVINAEVVEVTETVEAENVVEPLPETKKKVKTKNIKTTDIEENEQKITINKLAKKSKTSKKTKKKTLPDNFAKLLKAKEKENSNVVEKKTSELQNTYAQMQSIIKDKSVESPIDYIVVAAYCLTHHENIFHFSEQQLQAKIAPFVDDELHHNCFLDAVDKNYIRVLPDFTGVSDTIEFELTETGEEYFLNEL